MKTVEEKAKKYAEETILALYSDSELMQDFVQKQKKYAKVDFLAGYNEGQSNPKIKQLEWKKFGKGKDLISKVLLGDYIISDNCSTYKLFINRVREGHSFFNLNDAKQFAQSHFEARVKECLTTE